MPCPHLQRGTRNQIAVVLSCPGRVEEERNSPAQGATGTNLDCLLDIMRDSYHFDYSDRRQLTITNAWSRVEYVTQSSTGRTGRTEPTLGEVLCPGNLDRLACDIDPIEHIIICCGNLARQAIQRLQYCRRLRDGIRVARLPHLGNQSINRKFKTNVLNLHARSLNISPPRTGAERRGVDLELTLRKLHN